MATPPHDGVIGAFYRILESVELAAARRDTTNMRDTTVSSRRHEAAKKMPSHFRAQEKRGGAVYGKDRHGYRRLACEQSVPALSLAIQGGLAGHVSLPQRPAVTG